MTAERYGEALEAIDRAIAINPAVALFVELRALCLAGLGRHEEVRSEIARLENWQGPDPVGPFAMGMAYMALDDVERGLDQWEAAVRQRDFFMPYLRVISALRPLRAHPRFQAILQSMWPDHGPFEVD